MAGEGPEASIENPSEGERCAAGLSSTSAVRTETHGTSISFAVKYQKILKEKLQPERDPSPLPPASRPSTVWVCPWLTGSDPAGHRHLGERAGTRTHTTGLQQQHHVARPETTAPRSPQGSWVHSGKWRLLDGYSASC